MTTRKPSAKALIRALGRMKKNFISPVEFFSRWNKYRRMLYDTPEYKFFMTEVKDTADRKCELCGRAGREVHHKVRVYDDPSLTLCVDNGIYLCVRCHKKQHKQKRLS